jgi:predicted nucleic acid-binding protein
MGGLYVLDTNALIAYFDNVFSQPQVLSAKVRALISSALSSSPSPTKLSIPSIVFIEVFEKWLKTEEIVQKFHFEVFKPIEQSPNIEIRAIEQEILENLIRIGDELKKHEIHDKIVLASAMTLNCPLITSDSAVTKYVEKYGMIPAVIF